MFSFRNINNACSQVIFDEYNFLFDPWISKGIYDGGWGPYPPIKKNYNFNEVTHCFISHIHEDHFDLNVLNKLSKSVKMLIPENFPNHIMVSKLQDLKFSNIITLPRSERIEIERGVFFEVIPPMNSSGLLKDMHWASQSSDFAIDTGLIFEAENKKLVLLSDNTPYEPQHAGKSLEHMENCDLLAFNFNGAAQDYPLCYNMSLEEKQKIVEKNEKNREQSTLNLIKKLSPKKLLAYSSEFAAMGPMARKFVQLHEKNIFVNNKKTAKRYQENTGIETLCLYEDDIIYFKNDGIQVENNTKNIPSLEEVAEEYYYSEPRINSKYPQISFDGLIKNYEKSFKNMLLKCDEKKLIPETQFILTFSDITSKNFRIDFKEQKFFIDNLIPEKFVRCWLPSSYLDAILTRKTSWNSAILSFQLKWERKPEIYDDDLYVAMNFLTLPRS